jgi:hypothetical protein
LETVAVPEVKEFPSDELSTATSSSLSHAINAKEANNNHFFYHCFLI